MKRYYRFFATGNERLSGPAAGLRSALLTARGKNTGVYTLLRINWQQKTADTSSPTLRRRPRASAAYFRDGNRYAQAKVLPLRSGGGTGSARHLRYARHPSRHGHVLVSCGDSCELFGLAAVFRYQKSSGRSSAAVFRGTFDCQVRCGPGWPVSGPVTLRHRRVCYPV